MKVRDAKPRALYSFLINGSLASENDDISRTFPECSFNMSPKCLYREKNKCIKMTIRTKISIASILLVLTVSILPVPVSAAASAFFIHEPYALPSDTGFDGNKNEQTKILRELSFGDHVAFPIVQQPHGDMTFVSPLQDYVTEYRAAAKFDTIGLLAHNYLAGQYFFQIVKGEKITLSYSDSGSEKFVVTEIIQYQALTPQSPSSDFIDLATGERLSASQVFRRTYAGQAGRLILQTCISANENPSWGRIFIIAEPDNRVTGVE